MTEQAKPFQINVLRTEDGGYASEIGPVLNGLVFENWHALDRVITAAGDTRTIHFDTISGELHLGDEYIGNLEVYDPWKKLKSIQPKGQRNRRKPKYKAESAFILELEGSTSISILESTANRLVSKYTTCGWRGPHQHAYKNFATGWNGNLWNIVVLRACHNFLQATGMTHAAASNLIRNQIYLAMSFNGQGRPAGVRGERRGDGRKTHGTNREFVVGQYKRKWIQIPMSNSVAAVLDCCNALRIRFAVSIKVKSFDWSRQKNLTFLSMANKVPGHKTPLMSEFFFQDAEAF